jgi:hypothetical protein
MTEWLQSKLSEQLHSIMKEPQTTACGHYFIEVNLEESFEIGVFYAPIIHP